MSDESLVQSSSVSAAPIQDREQLLEDLRGWIHDGRELGSSPDPISRCTLALVEGSSGVGKSWLIQESISAANTGSAEAPVLCCRVQCHERQGIPFLPILRLIKDLILHSGEESALWKRYAHVLARVFPELRQELGEGELKAPLPGRSGRIQFHEALGEILFELAQGRTLILVLHDLHRSDPGTIEFVEFLARNSSLSWSTVNQEGGMAAEADTRDWKHIRAREGRSGEFASAIIEAETVESDDPEPAGRLLLIADHGPGIDSGQTQQALKQLEQQPFCQSLEVPPFTEEEAGALLKKLVGDEVDLDLCATITTACAGNPLLIGEFGRVLVESGVATPIEVESVQALIESAQGRSMEEILLERRLAALPPLERKVLEHLALLMRPVQASLLAKSCAVTEERLVAALTELGERGYLQIQEVQGAVRYAIAHELHLHGIRDFLGKEPAARLQMELAKTLASHDRSSEPVRAYEVFELFDVAGQSAAAISPGMTAMRFFAEAYAEPLAINIGRRLLQHVAGEQHVVERREILSILARIEMETGHPQAAKSHIKELIAEVGLDPGIRFESQLFLSNIYLQINEPLKGIKVLNRVSNAELEAAGPLSQARVSTHRARLRLKRLDLKRAMSLCLRAQKEFTGLEEDDDATALQCQIFEVTAETHLARGDSAAALNCYQRVLELIEQGSDSVALGAILRTIGRVYYDRGKHFRAARYLFRAMEVVEKSQDLKSLAATYDLLGKIYRNSGDFARSLAYFRRSLHLSERIGDSTEVSPTLNSIGSLHAHSGDYSRAVRYFKRSISNSEKHGSTRGIVQSFLHLGWTWFALGERKQVENLARQILILSQEFELPEHQAEGHRLQGNLALLRGEWKTAAKELKKAEDLAQRRGSERVVTASCFDQAQLSLEQEQYEAALKVVTRGMVNAESLQSVPLLVRGLLLKGAIGRQRSEDGHVRALEQYEKALQMITGDSLLPLQWQIHYAMARVLHSNHEIEGAKNHYEQASALVERISQRLPEDMRVVFRDDRRRKDFFTDLLRFRKETATSIPTPHVSIPEDRSSESKSGGVSTVETIATEEGSSLFFNTLQSLGKHSELRLFLAGLLEEIRRVVPSPRGFIAARRRRRWQSLADVDMGPEEDWLPPQHALGALAQETLSRGTPLRSGDADWEEWVETHPEGSSLRGRSLVAIPFEASELFSAALVLERPTAGHPFQQQEMDRISELLTLVRGQLAALAKTADLLEYEQSEIGSRAALDDDLSEMLFRHQRDKEPLGFLEVSFPGLDLLLRDREDELFVRQLIETLQPIHGVYHTGGDHLICALIGTGEENLRKRCKDLQHVLLDLREQFNLPMDVPVTVLPHWFAVASPEISSLSSSGSDYFKAGTQPILEQEVASLTSGELSLKEAKTALEKRYIIAELFRSGGNITRAAEALGIHRPQLSNLLKRHEIRKEDFEGDSGRSS
ncbi:MAG: hypothetical protein CBC13_07130 [Planctomycetia bacterium TMED53]|nr:MAG: hypothetical protein CBC13_07130 [Planctomycetia bacterium TMED53]